MNKLTQKVLDELNSENAKWTELTVEKVEPDCCGHIIWRLKKLNNSQSGKDLYVRYDVHGTVSVGNFPDITVMDSDIDDEKWMLSTVEHWGWAVDDVHVVLKQKSQNFSNEQRFGNLEFISMYPRLEDEVTEAHEVCLVVRDVLFNFLAAQFAIAKAAA